jgi:hypothetical protein
MNMVQGRFWGNGEVFSQALRFLQRYFQIAMINLSSDIGRYVKKKIHM